MNLKYPDLNFSTKLNIRFRDVKGQIITDTSVNPEKSGWQQLVIPVTAPKGTAVINVMLSVSASEASFDDVAFHKMP